jgi:Zinc carboxypeptidase
MRILSLVAGAVLCLGGCVTAPPPERFATRAGGDCSTSAARITFDVETAPRSSCAVLGERAFAILVAPEHVPPINPSPWYAFRYATSGAEGISVRLDYIGARHRYAPKLMRGGEIAVVPVEVSNDGRSALLVLPPGDGIVAAQEPFGASRYERLLDRMAAMSHAERIKLGRSLDGRAIEAVRFGGRTAPALVVLLGRQHPPETTGAVAMEAFLLALADQLPARRNLIERIQFLAIPELNPDGVARGHWRANRGGIDLNRDWGEFSQPETRAVKTWLDALPHTVRPVAMLDFHSTGRNLFYVQSDEEADKREEQFLDSWLGGKAAIIDDYPFEIERRDANPGSGTAKNWFHEIYDIPAYTYEVGDETQPETIRRSASLLARSYLVQLEKLLGSPENLHGTR